MNVPQVIPARPRLPDRTPPEQPAARRKAARFTLVQKLIASYAFILGCAALSLAFAVIGLYSISSTAKGIVVTDLPAFGTIYRLRELLISQERSAGRYLILHAPEYLDLYRRSQAEFRSSLQKLRTTDHDPILSTLSDNYQRYIGAVEHQISTNGSDGAEAASTAERVFRDIEALSLSHQHRIDQKLAEAKEKEITTIRMTFFLCGTGFALAVIGAAFFCHSLAVSLKELKTGTHRIAAGDFDYDPCIPPGDEVGDLAEDFMLMARKLKELEQLNLDASPLTRLPGNLAIERNLDQRLHEGAEFAVCYADLDNFKAYNDRYGYIKASAVIKHTADIIHAVVWELGGDKSFVGHIGGDDFVMVVPADRAATVCEAVIRNFSEMITHHYTDRDLAAGGIEGVDRYGVSRFFPIMTISIAALVSRKGIHTSAAEIAEAATPIKSRLKELSGSNYLVHREGTVRS